MERGSAPGGSAMAGTQVPVGMLCASPLFLKAEALVHGEADYDMPGTNRLVGLRLYNKNVAVCGFGARLAPFTVVSSQSHHLS